MEEVVAALGSIEECEARGELATRGQRFVEYMGDGFKVPALASWYLDDALGGLCNHEARSHMPADLRRYLFCSSYARVHQRSPKLGEFPPQLLPDHKNVNEGVNGNHFSDRFRVQRAGKPASTITSHISKDGHYFIHYDPTQCRSLTVREAAEFRRSPDNYFFEGNRTEQYTQVGNAVPPLLARQIALIVAEALGAAATATKPTGSSAVD